MLFFDTMKFWLFSSQVVDQSRKLFDFLFMDSMNQTAEECGDQLPTLSTIDRLKLTELYWKKPFPP